MKKLFFTILLGLTAAVGMAQVPDIINYQAVARNNAGAALANQTIKVRLSIMQNSSTIYSETRQVTTNLLGLFNVQIGSPGALIVVGDLETLDWNNNPAPGYQLKAELDINNTNVFTDMGSQKLVSVPYALQAKSAAEANIAVEAIEPRNINGLPIDRTVVPTATDRLMYNGSKWVTVKKDTVMMVSGFIGNIPVTPGVPWVFAGPTKTITVTGTETIVANFTGSFGHSGAINALAAVAICFENISGGSITSFDPLFSTDASILSSPTKTLLAATGAIKLPAGTYRIGLGIKNRSIATIFNANDNMTGTIEIKY